MSSAYLTSKNMTMIERLLLEVRAVPRNRSQETMRARFLIDQFQGGVTAEADLRSVLNVREVKGSDTSRRSVVSRAVGGLWGELQRDFVRQIANAESIDLNHGTMTKNA